MKTASRFFLIVLAYLLIQSSTVFAGGGGASGGALESTQLLNKGFLKDQISNQVKQISNQVTMINDLIYNSEINPEQLYSDVGTLYKEIDSVMSKTEGVIYKMSNLDEEMGRRFKTYWDLKNTMQGVPDFQKEYRDLNKTREETTKDTLKALGVAEKNLKDDMEVIKQLQESATTAGGRNQILQASNEIAAFQAQMLLKLQELIMLQHNLTAVAMESDRAQDDLAQASHERAFGVPQKEEYHAPVDHLGW